MSYEKLNRIHFVSTFNMSFVRRDIKILEKHYPLVINLFNHKQKNILNLLKTIRNIFIGVKKSRLSYIWFADLRALITVLLSNIMNKKTIVIVGGYEVVDLPEIDYGGLRRKRYQLQLKLILKFADIILAVSKSINESIVAKTGYKKAEVIYNGVEPKEFYAKGKKEDVAITVGYVKRSNLTRKGLKDFVESAKYNPNIKYYLIGKVLDDSINDLKSIAPDNLEFVGFVSFEKLKEYYQKAKVYVQTSAHEGFGIALAEAMLSECVPVVTNRGALPEVVGNTGVYVDYDNPKQTAAAIREAVNSKNGNAARERIKKLYSMDLREKKIITEIRRLL